MAPSAGSKNRASSLTRLLLPAPFPPRMATDAPAAIEKPRSRNRMLAKTVCSRNSPRSESRPGPTESDAVARPRWPPQILGRDPRRSERRQGRPSDASLVLRRAASGPVASYKCAVGSVDEGVYMSLHAPAVRSLLSGGDENRNAEVGTLSPDEVLAFHETAKGMIRDLQNTWSNRDVGLRCLEVSNRSPSLIWSTEGDLVSTGFARPESVVVIVGFEIAIEGIARDVLNPTIPGPEGNRYAPALVLCYNHEVAKANAL